MRRLRLSIAIAAALAASLVAKPDAEAAARHPRCDLLFTAGALCYAPAQLPEAVAHLRFVPVNPSFAVRSVTHLRLSQVIFSGNQTVGQIYFVYGTIPASGHGMIPLPSPTFPKWVVISEDGHLSGPWRVARTIGHLANGKPRYDPWNLYANHLDVTGNFSRATIKRMGLMVLQRAAAGK